MENQVYAPGKAILESLDWLKMSKEDFSKRLGISIEYLNKLISGELPISNELALSLESVTGSPKAYWKMLERKSKKSVEL